MTRQVDQLARHVRRLGNHELNELLLQLPQSSFAALVQVALARPVLPAGLLLRFEEAAGVNGWTVVPYKLPADCVAAYFPEANPLVPLGSTAIRSGTPTSKCVIVSVKPAQ